MATSIATPTANAVLAAMTGGASFTNSQVWVKLHVGDPGPAGTANPAGEATRRQAAFGAASGGSVATNAALNWVAVAGTETYTHVTLWSASTGGTLLASGLLSASPIIAGDNFQIPSGDLVISFEVAA